MLRTLNKYFLILSLAFIATHAHAQKWSYVYIQGDKEIPFYVKLEDEMLPRFSKNYYIIPELGPGPIHIQILFQQNEYPPLSFKILVPDASFRGFLLTRKDNNFALYDIQQRFYLLPGEEGEDHLPEIIPITASTNRKAVTPVDKKETKKAAPRTTEPKPKKSNTNDPQFIDNLELNNEHAAQNEPVPVPEKQTNIGDEPAVEDIQEPLAQNEPSPQTVPANQPVIRDEPPVETIAEPAQEDDRITDAQVNLTNNTAPIINSDCPEPMGEEAFDKIYTNVQGKSEGQKRISYLLDKVKNNCFSTRQAYFLAKQLNAESMRYSFLKKVYPRITDQQNFRLLEDKLFTTLEWKSYFRLIQ